MNLARQINSWTIEELDALRKVLVVELNQLFPLGDSKRIDFLRNELSRLESIEESSAQIRRFICVMILMNHQAKYGGLKRAELHKLEKLAEVLLQVGNFSLDGVGLEEYASALETFQAQNMRRSGDAIGSAWIESLSWFKSASFKEHGLHNLSLGKCHYRLGNIGAALIRFQNAQNYKVTPNIKWLAKLYQLKCFRLLGDFEKAKKLVRQSLSALNQASNKEFVIEFKWELAWLSIAQKPYYSFDVFSQLVDNQDFRSAAYMSELFMYGFAHPDERFLKAMPNYKFYSMRNRFSRKNLGSYSVGLKIISDCFDEEIPIEIRIKSIQEGMHLARSFPSVEKEILFYLAAHRFLHSIELDDLSDYTASEIKSLGRRISNGKTADYCGLLGLIESSTAN